MKIERLDLIAFGKFSGQSLDFSDDRCGLNIIFGPNEAGKSSTLRAITYLLFGMPQHCSDNFLFENKKLRIGGTLRNSAGETLSFVRRKGVKETVLTPDGKTLPDSVLDRYLYGIRQEIFTAMFGIGHEELVRGGADILKGSGEIGESLFSAGMGGPSLKEIQSSLEEKSIALFKFKGENPTLNRLFKEYDAAKKKVAELSLKSREWEQLKEAVERNDSELASLKVDLARAKKEKNKIGRIEQSATKLARRDEILSQLSALGEVAALPSDFANSRIENINRLRAAKEKAESAATAIKRLKEEIQTIPESGPALEHADAITKLHKDINIHVKAARDRIGLEGELRKIRDDAAVLCADLWPGADVSEARKLLPGASVRAQVRELASRYRAIEGDFRRAERELADAVKSSTDAEQLSAAAGQKLDATGLKAALDDALGHGNIETECEKELSILKSTEQQIEMESMQLSPPKDTLEHLPLALLETIDVEKFNKEFTALSNSKNNVAEKLDAAKSEISTVEKKIAELGLGGETPGENDLEGARARRDHGWALVRRAWLGGEDVTAEASEFDSKNPLPEAYEASVRAADEFADLLRNDADRIAKHAEYTNAKKQEIEKAAALAGQQEEIEKSKNTLTAEWAALWTKFGIEPNEPHEMRSWLARARNVMDKLQIVRAGKLKIEELRANIEKHKKAICDNAAPLDESFPAGDSLGMLIRRGQGITEKTRDANSKIDALIKAAKDASGSLEKARRARDESAEERERWKEDWKAAMERLGLPENTDPLDANGVLDKIEELSSRMNEALKLENRISGIKSDDALFAESVAQIAGEVSPGLAALPRENAVNELHRLLEASKKNVQARSDKTEKIAERENELLDANDVICAASARLDELRGMAQCEKNEELEAAEQRSGEYVSLKKELGAVDDLLRTIGNGAPIAQLAEEVRAADLDSLAALKDETEKKIESIEKDVSRLEQEKGGLGAQLARMDGGADAAIAAETAQNILPQIRSASEQFMRLKAASLILKREIESYRSESQGPLLKRSGELFSAMTLGNFSGLAADFNEKDEKVLLGVRASGGTVAVEGMSDGTLDQLYLSLRLASLEKFVESGEPMPFIVDDILIRFDDDRSRETLKALAELSEKTQVLFFTHHARLEELARDIPGADRIKIHRL